MGEVSAARSTQGSREPPVASQHMLGQLFGEVSRELGSLVQHEVELAKAQLREESGAAATTDLRAHLTVMAVALSVLFASLAAAWGLAAVLPTGVAFLVVAVVYGVAAGVLVAQRRRGEAGAAGEGTAPGQNRIELVEGRAELR
jgi:hypothetical protein